MNKKNGKLIKKIISFFTLFMILLSSSSQILAAYTQTTKYVRSDGYTYYSNGYDNGGNYKVKDYSINDNFDYYCMDQGLLAAEEYSDKQEVNYNSTEIPSNVGNSFKNKNGLNAKQNYLAFQWLIKNMYVINSNHTATEKQLMIDNINTIISQYGGSYSSYRLTATNISEENLTIINRALVWKFITSSKESGGIVIENDITEPEDFKRFTWSNGYNKYTYSDEDCKIAYAVYSSLFNGAKAYAKDQNKYSIKIMDNTTYKLTLKTTNANLTKVGEKHYRLGPINLNFEKKDGTKADYSKYKSVIKKISWDITNKDSLTNIRYTDQNGNRIKNGENYANINDLINNGEYYMDFYTPTELDASDIVRYSVNAEFNMHLTKCKSYVYTEDNYQPLIEVEKKLSKSPNSQSSIVFKDPNGIKMDLALTKEISEIYRENSKIYDSVSANNDGKRLQKISGQYGANGDTTADYMMNKTPIVVRYGDKIRYKITVYNEGNVKASLSSIVDYIPKGLTPQDYFYIDNNFETQKNISYINENKQAIKMMLNKKIEVEGKTEVIFDCVVNAYSKPGDTLTNVAEIENASLINVNGVPENQQKDIDSTKNNVFSNITKTTDIDDLIATYTTELKNKEIDEQISYLNKKHFSKEDDDDFEQIRVGNVDLALRQFITKVGNNEIQDRSPKIYSNTINIFQGGGTTAKYRHKKVPVEVKDENLVEYTIRIFNEGEIPATAREIKNYLPSNLEFLPNNQINKQYGWSESGTESGLKVLKTNYLNGISNLIKPANYEEGYKKIIALGSNDSSDLGESERFYKDIKLVCKVKRNEASDEPYITNIAEISSYSYQKLGENIVVARKDVDSKTYPNVIGNLNESYSEESSKISAYIKHAEATAGRKVTTDSVNYFTGMEDDDDFENLILDPIDLALRKFITKVGSKTVEREPQITADSVKKLKEYGTASYYHDKQPVIARTGETILYTIRIYNEGSTNAYAREITDYLPQGLEYISDSEINSTYKWNAETVNGITKLTTTYLAGKTIKASNKEEGYNKLVNNQITDSSQEFWRDVELECKVTSKISDEILTNVAEITKYGYLDKSVAEIVEISKDIDSNKDNVFNNEKFEQIKNIESYYANSGIENNTESSEGYFSGYEDDDDFENIKVQSLSTTFRLKKTDENGNGLNGSRFIVNRIKALNEEPNLEENILYYAENTKSLINPGHTINVIESSTMNDLEIERTYFYKIEEINSAPGYKNIFEGYSILIPMFLDEYGKINLVSNGNITPHLYYDDNSEEYIGFVIVKNSDGTVLGSENELYGKVDIIVYNQLTIPELLVKVKNPKIEGEYNLRVVKQDENNNKISGMKFNYELVEDYGQTYARTSNGQTQNTNENGETFVALNKEITNEGLDYFKITEIRDDENNYYELDPANPIEIYINKKERDENYVVNYASFSKTNKLSSKSYKLISGEYVEVKISNTDNDIYLEIPNKTIDGSYTIKAIKTNEDGTKKLAGVKFAYSEIENYIEGEVNETQSEEKITQSTNSNGETVIANNVKIKQPGVDKYTISEIDLGNNTYIPTSEPIEIYVKKELQDSQTTVQEFKIKEVSLKSFEQNSQVVLTENISLDKEGKSGTVNLELNQDNNEITVSVSNVEISGEYNLYIKKEDENNNPIENIGFKVNVDGINFDTEMTDSEGFCLVKKQKIGSNLSKKDCINISKEIILNDKYYCTLTQGITIYVSKKLDKDLYEYKVDKVSFSQDDEGSTEISTLAQLSYNNGEEIDVNVTAKVSDGDVIVTIPNKEIKGSYGMKIKKVDQDNNNLSGVSFNIQESNEITYTTPETNDQGETTVFEDKKITENNLIQSYTISEAQVDENSYIKLAEDIKVYVKTGIENNKFIIKDYSLEDISNGQTSIKEADYGLQDGSSTVHVKLIMENNMITVTIPNKPVPNKYKLTLKKVDTSLKRNCWYKI